MLSALGESSQLWNILYQIWAKERKLEYEANEGFSITQHSLQGLTAFCDEILSIFFASLLFLTRSKE